jgi:hypothetical protein
MPHLHFHSSNLSCQKRLATPANISLDLRHSESFKNFKAARFTFKINTSKTVNLTTHHDTPEKNVEVGVKISSDVSR